MWRRRGGAEAAWHADKGHAEPPAATVPPELPPGLRSLEPHAAPPRVSRYNPGSHGPRLARCGATPRLLGEHTAPIEGSTGCSPTRVPAGPRPHFPRAAGLNQAASRFYIHIRP